MGKSDAKHEQASENQGKAHAKEKDPNVVRDYDERSG
jgi:hypothetical protein